VKIGIQTGGVLLVKTPIYMYRICAFIYTNYTKNVGLINQTPTIGRKGLNSPPVREFYEDAVIVLAIPA